MAKKARNQVPKPSLRAINFAEQHKLLLRRYNASIRTLASDSGISRARVESWGKGKLPRHSDFGKLKHFYITRGMREDEWSNIESSIKAEYAMQEVSRAQPSEILLKRGTVGAIFDELSGSAAADPLLDDLESLSWQWLNVTGAYEEMEKGDTAIAKELLEEIRNNESATTRLKVTAVIGLARVHRYRGDIEAALNTINQAKREFKQAEQSYPIIWAQLEVMTGDLHRRKGNLTEATAAYTNAMIGVKRIKENTIKIHKEKKELVSQIAIKQAGNAIFKGQYIEALSNCRSCRDLSEESLRMEAKILQHEAWANAMLGKWDEALSAHTYVVSEIDALSKKTSERVKARRYKADILRMMGRFAEAGDLYEDASTMLDEHSNENLEESEVLLRIPILLGRAQLLTTSADAIAILQDAYKRNTGVAQIQPTGHSIERTKDLFHLALTLSAIGMQLAKSDPTEAHEYYESAFKLFNTLGNKYYLHAMQYNVALLTGEEVAVPSERNLGLVSFRIQTLNEINRAKSSPKERKNALGKIRALINNFAAAKMQNAYLSAQTITLTDKMLKLTPAEKKTLSS